MQLLRAIVFALVVATVSAAERDPAKPPTVEYARSTRLEVDWPGARDREALVILEFDVLANGKAANIRVADDGFHEKRFVNAAIAGLKSSQWQPRRVNGEAVDSTGMRKSFRFSIEDMEPGVTKEFKAEARKVEELLQKGDFAGGEFHAQWMLAEKVKLNYEYALLEAELAQTYAGLGRIEDAVRKVSRATARSDSRPEFLQLLDTPPPNKPSNYLLQEKELIVQLLGFRMRLLAAQGLALEAMQSYYELAGLEKPSSDDPLAALAAQLTAQIRGTGNLRGRIEIGQGRVWRQFLSRRSFGLEEVEGGIDAMHITCSANSKPLAYQPGEQWTVPEGWGVCSVQVAAEPGTKFEFVEFPDTIATL